MKIGSDFSPVEFNLFGYDLIEPNALIGDTIIALISLFFAYKVSQFKTKSLFFKNWNIFFIIFGISFIGGGLGHSFFNQWGVEGKYFGWITSIIAVYFIEQAMISLYPDTHKQSLFKKLSVYKFILAEISLILIFILADLVENPQKGLLVPSVSTAIGFITCLLLLGLKYQKSITPSFKWLWISVLTMVPSAIFQGMKISVHPLFDRNDMSHILLVLSLVFYFMGVKGYYKHSK